MHFCRWHKPNICSNSEDSEYANDGIADSDSCGPDALHAFIGSRCLEWGCNDCFNKSQLRAYRDQHTQKWSSKKAVKNKMAVSKSRKRAIKHKRKSSTTVKRLMGAGRTDAGM